MATDGEDRRFFGGPRALGALLPRLTRPAFKRRSPAGAALMADWPAAVGPALAAVSTPKRLGNGTLVIACAGPVATELTHLAPQLIGRINAHLGQVAVERLRFVQQASSGSAASPAAPSPRAAGALPPRVREAVAAVPGGELREALEKLARGVYRNRDGGG
jgi:hypothetical protein